MPEAEAKVRRARIGRSLALFFAAFGVLHFAGSLAAWGLFYVGSYRQGWNHVFRLSYAIAHVLPALILLGLFTWACVATWRRHRLALPLVTVAIAFALVVFTIEVRGQPQFERVWVDDPTSCTNRQAHYCTWYWYQPTRH